LNVFLTLICSSYLARQPDWYCWVMSEKSKRWNSTIFYMNNTWVVINVVNPPFGSETWKKEFYCNCKSDLSSTVFSCVNCNALYRKSSISVVIGFVVYRKWRSLKSTIDRKNIRCSSLIPQYIVHTSFFSDGFQNLAC